jgi:uridine phosphorylase
MDTKVLAGDVVVATGAIRSEGTSREYMPLEFPAVADFYVSNALAQAASELGCRYHVGVVQGKDSFYGQHEPERMPVRHQLLDNWQAWLEGGCLASEMESPALFIISSVLHARAGSVNLCLGNQERRKLGHADPEIEDYDLAIKTGILAVRKLIAADQR